MLDIYLYSLAGKKAHPSFDDELNVILESIYISKSHKDIVSHTIEIGKHGSYPSMEYYAQFFPYTTRMMTPAEIHHHYEVMMDFYKRSYFIGSVTKAINEAETSNQLIGMLGDVVASSELELEDDEEDYEPITYTKSLESPKVPGIKTGVEEIDTLTCGFQPGNIASICAYTGEGKTTFWLSIAYLNALAGKKVLYISIEMSPELVWPAIEARYLADVKNLPVSITDLRQKNLSKAMAKAVQDFEEDYKNDIQSNLTIVDETKLTKERIQSDRKMKQFFKKVEHRMGGLDLVIFDHVNQINLMYTDSRGQGLGNVAIKTIQTAAKTYKTEAGSRIVAGLAVQANREGKKRAQRRGGHYDMQAIGDLNEVERASSYVIFIHTEPIDVINQETKTTMPKHRLGSVLDEVVTTRFIPSLITVGDDVEYLEGGDLSEFGEMIGAQEDGLFLDKMDDNILI